MARASAANTVGAPPAPAALKAAELWVTRAATCADAINMLEERPATAAAMGSELVTSVPAGRPSEVATLTLACAAVNVGLAAISDCAIVVSGLNTELPVGADRLKGSGLPVARSMQVGDVMRYEAPVVAPTRIARPLPSVVADGSPVSCTPLPFVSVYWKQPER